LLVSSIKFIPSSVSDAKKFRCTMRSLEDAAQCFNAGKPFLTLLPLDTSRDRDSLVALRDRLFLHTRIEISATMEIIAVTMSFPHKLIFYFSEVRLRGVARREILIVWCDFDFWCSSELNGYLNVIRERVHANM
jgi:hypothetical protein